MQWSRFLGFIFLSFVVLLPACTATKSSKHSQSEAQVRSLLAQGDYLAAAQHYLNRINDTDQLLEKDRYRIQAIEYLIKANRVRSADSQLQQLHSTNPNIQVRQYLAIAEIKIAQGNVKSAVDVLSRLKMDKIPLTLRPRYHQLFQLVLEQAGYMIPALYQRLYLDPSLKAMAQQENQAAIWQALQTLSNEQLRNMPIPAPNTLRGWLSLVLALRENNNIDFNSLWQRWQQIFPHHPANLALIQNLQQQTTKHQPRIYQNNSNISQQIAVFLPKAGRFQQFSNKVRDGLLAAWYESDINNRPSLHFYDAKPETIAAEYQKAIDAGAQLAIGPLGKKAVTALSQAYPRLPIATIFLSPSANLQMQYNAFQLSLSTEQEAQLIADKALNDGLQRAAILAPDNAWGQQALQAFSERFEAQGGQIVDYALYENNYDYPVKQVINAAPDMVFIVAKSLVGRQLVPRFRYYKGGDIRLYATAQIYQGNPNPRRDHDLNGVSFPDLPWVLLKGDWRPNLALSTVTESNNPPPKNVLISSAQGNNSINRPQSSGLYQKLENYWANHLQHNGQRLLALGADAYRVLDYLYTPKNYPDGFDGATGLLNLNAQGQLMRQLPWAQFTSGQPRLISSTE